MIKTNVICDYCKAENLTDCWTLKPETFVTENFKTPTDHLFSERWLSQKEKHFCNLDCLRKYLQVC